MDDGFSPATVNNRVVYAGGHDDYIYALDARDVVPGDLILDPASRRP